jgi:hypothetical protein
MSRRGILVGALFTVMGFLAFLGVRATAEESKKDAAPAPATAQPEADLTILLPRELQVTQRETKAAGHVFLNGRVKADCDKVEAKFSGKGADGKDLPDEWHALTYDAPAKRFQGKAKLPAGGWYKLEVRASKGGNAVATATREKVGVGEVFVIAGQSNSTNSGQFPTQQTSGMVSSFSGMVWKIADDPQIGTHDKSKNGSPWPAFGDAMYASYKVPIGIASTGFGGTSTAQWQPDAKEALFPWMMTRIQQLGPGGFRAVLWHQGESDAIGGVSTDDYVTRLTNVIKASKEQAGWEFPWFVAQVSYINPEKMKIETIRTAQKKIWDSGVAFEGPDTDTLTGDNRDMDGKGIHFSPKGLKAHGEMWVEKVGAYLDKVLH